ncbi:MAG: tetratricopeptide repeat protein [Elusimicrobia bacterium]|nr:tetratricopeptide repeat protein [Elusimicrobiota bacterium]
MDIEDIKRAINSEPEKGELNAELAREYENAGMYEEAIAELETAAEKGYDRARVYRDMGRLYCDRGEHDKAIELLRSVIERGMESADLHKELGRAYSEKGEYEPAFESLSRAVRMSPENSEFRREMGKLYYSMGNWRMAEKEMTLASEHDPANGQINYELARIKMISGDTGAVKRELEKAAEKDFENEFLRIRLGSIYRESGMNDRAEEQFIRAGLISENKDKPWFKNRIINEIEICRGKSILASKPRSLTAALTSRCNMKCIMCEVRKHPWELPAETAVEIKGMLPFLEQITWQGGEVFLSPFFDGLFEKAAECEGLRQHILTSGLPIDERWAGLLSETDVNLIFSIDGIVRETYEKIRVGADFNELRKRLEMVNGRRQGRSGRRQGLSMQMVVMEENYRDLPGVIDFLKENNMDRLHLVPLDSSINKEGCFYEAPEVADFIGKALKDIRSQAQECNIQVISSLPVTVKSVPEGSCAVQGGRHESTYDDISCYLPWQQFGVCAGGSVIIHGFCTHMPLGDISENSLAEIWNNSIMQSLRKAIAEKKFYRYCNTSCVRGIIPREARQIDF